MPPVLDRTSEKTSWLVVVLAMALVFAALAPTLTTMELSRTLENLNVQTALECRRDGHWFEPTLEGLPRTKKPPLAAWITGAAMRPSTVEACGSRDPAVRAAAFRRLAGEARWPALFQMCLALAAVYLLGRALNVGADAALFCASTYLFLRYAQVSLTDAPLTLWVITANACLAMAAFGGRRRSAALAAGAALGLAFMAKGPVAFVQTLLPWAVWWAWERRKRDGEQRRRWGGPILLGVLAFVLVALPWYLAVFLKNPHEQWHVWFKEVTGTDAPERGTPFYGYLAFIPQFLPGLLFAIPGMWLAFRNDDRDERTRLRAMVCLIVVPLVVQSCFKQKADRYLLPLVGPMAVLAAAGLRHHLETRPAEARRDVGGFFYWFVLAAIAITLVILGTLGVPRGLRRADGTPWFPRPLGVAAGAVAVSLLVAATLAHVRRSRSVALFTLLFMLLTMHLIALGYGQSIAGRSRMRPLAERIWAQYPDARIYTSRPFGQRASEDLSIYLNRLTGWITADEMAAARPGDRPVIVLMKETAQPTQLTGAWHEFAQMPKEEGEEWRVVVMPASNQMSEKR